MKLKNYTTSVSAEKSIGEIEKILISFGATKIMKDYLTDGTVEALCFQFNGKGFKIPANVKGVMRSLGGNQTQAKEQQAIRVTWRIIRDWVHSQMSLIVSGQAEPEQALLPYIWDGRKTLYEHYKQGSFKLLPAPEEKDQSEQLHIKRINEDSV